MFQSRGEEIAIRELGRPGDLGWVVMAHGQLYAEEFGWDTSFEALVAEIVAAYASAPPIARQAAWIAELGDPGGGSEDPQRVGCVFCVPDPDDDDTARLRILLVDPAARGHALGSCLVERALAFAGEAGYRRMRLWTNHPLVAARRIYLRHGFALIGSEPHHSFGLDLVGQVYERDLTSA